MDTVGITAIIIDDDSEAIYLLEMYLRQFPEVMIIGKSTKAPQGLALVNKKLPDLVFLDIDMPDMTGLQVAESMKNKNFHSEIVFTTAYQQYAYKALTIEPLDFLTKPFCPEDLQKVIKKYIAKAEKKIHEQKLDKFIQSQSNLPPISVPTPHGFLFIDIKEIVYLKAKINGTEINLADGSVETVSVRINRLIELLNSSLMFQIHRGTYINLNYLVRIEKKKAICILRFNNTVHEEPISRSNINNFKKLDIFSTL
ncbi:MAG TPA: LytTR family DNA-binding domain-containing protein [Prolixibacteraceae bacterium]|jgi:DNA-binding LytR/AlgR family response regulator